MSSPRLRRRVVLVAGLAAAAVVPFADPVLATSAPGLGGAQERGLGGAQERGLGGAQERGLGGAQERGLGGAQERGLGGAMEGADDSGVVIESTGDPATAVVLPPVATVGQTASWSATIDVSIAAGGQDVDLTVQLALSSSVTEVATDGGYVAELTMERVELTNAPAGVDPATIGYSALAGVRFQQTFDPRGRVVSTEVLDADQLSAAARASANGFLTNLQLAQFVYPAEAVGVGAAWTAELEIATEGFAIPAEYRFEVSDIAGGRYTLAMSYQSEFGTTIDGVNATGTVSGLGRASGSLDNPLDVSVELGQTIDATSAGAHLTVAIGVHTSPGG